MASTTTPHRLEEDGKHDLSLRCSGTDPVPQPQPLLSTIRKNRLRQNPSWVTMENCLLPVSHISSQSEQILVPNYTQALQCRLSTRKPTSFLRFRLLA